MAVRSTDDYCGFMLPNGFHDLFTATAEVAGTLRWSPFRAGTAQGDRERHGDLDVPGASQASDSSRAAEQQRRRRRSHCRYRTLWVTPPETMPGVSAPPSSLPLNAWSVSPGVDAVVTALVLAAPRPSVSATSNGRVEPSAMRGVRVCGEIEGSD